MITSDRHPQIRKYMREEQKGIIHQFDVWHFCKNIKQKLLAASSSAGGKRELRPWVKSITHHFWWACSTYEGDSQVLREKWLSIIFHLQNIHQWTGFTTFTQCAHAPLSTEIQRQKNWLSPTSDSFKALQEIIFSNGILNDLPYLTKFSHTGNIEVYHSLYNKWVPKSLHFSYQGMIARSQLAVLDFNSGANLKQALTKDGKKRYNTSFSKMTTSWSAKPIKESKSSIIFHRLVHRTEELVSEIETLPILEIPELPRNIASTPKPKKEDIVNRQMSRFTVQKN